MNPLISRSANPGASTKTQIVSRETEAFFQSNAKTSAWSIWRRILSLEDLRFGWQAIWQQRSALHIHCGHSDPNPKVETKTRAARAEVSPAQGFDGCGRLMVVWQAYRCVECNRFLHRDCAVKHFASHKS